MYLYNYQFWGADIVSDIELDLNDDGLKRKLAEVKIMIDRSGTVTDLFLIKSGKLRAFPMNAEVYKKYNIENDDFYEVEF